MGGLLSITPDVPVCRMLLYVAFAVAFWALVIGIIYLAHFRHVQDSEESGRWLSHVRVGPITNRVVDNNVPRPQAYRTKGICISSFLAFPTVWFTWTLLLLSVSFLSYVWTSPGELTTQVPDSSELAGHTSHFWVRFLPTAVFPVALWNIWVIWKVISNPLSETS